MSVHPYRVTFVVLALAAGAASQATILYDQMTSPLSTIIASSWVTPNGSDSDQYVWDNFLLPNPSTIREVWWIGGGGPTPVGFTVRFYEGLAAAPDLQPKITALPEEETPADYLKGYRFSGNANETPIGGGLFQYHVILPETFDLPGNTVFWVKIEADVTSFPSWGLARASHGRDEHHFKYITGAHMFFSGTGSTAFQLLGDAVPEPATLAVLGMGAAVLLRRRARS